MSATYSIHTRWGIRWMEFNRRDELVNKEKWFKTDKARARFIERRQETGNVYEVTSFCDPKESAA